MEQLGKMLEEKFFDLEDCPGKKLLNLNELNNAFYLYHHDWQNLMKIFESEVAMKEDNEEYEGEHWERHRAGWDDQDYERAIQERDAFCKRREEPEDEANHGSEEEAQESKLEEGEVQLEDISEGDEEELSIDVEPESEPPEHSRQKRKMDDGAQLDDRSSKRPKMGSPLVKAILNRFIQLVS